MVFDTEPLVKLPNPFELFNKKEGLENTNTTKKTPISSPASQPSAANDANNMQVNPKISFLGFLIAMILVLLFVLSGFYFIYSNFFLIDKLFQVPYYNIGNFWRYYRAPILSGKLTIFILTWLMVFGLNVAIFDVVYNIKDPWHILYITTIYFIGIVGSTFLIIGNIPSLVEIFENTIGYSVISMPFLYNLQKVTSVFKSKHFKSREFEIPYTFLITTFDVPSFHDMFQKLMEEGRKVKTGTSEINAADGIETDFYLEFPENITERSARYNLLKMVLTKNNIGHMTWTFIGSVITMMLTINTILPKK